LDGQGDNIDASDYYPYDMNAPAPSGSGDAYPSADLSETPIATDDPPDGCETYLEKLSDEYGTTLSNPSQSSCKSDPAFIFGFLDDNDPWLSQVKQVNSLRLHCSRKVALAIADLPGPARVHDCHGDEKVAYVLLEIEVLCRCYQNCRRSPVRNTSHTSDSNSN
jgi:hypothetical protein